MNGCKISVIIPVYNVAEYLDECVQSIVNQTYSQLEIILVDDGSSDRCPEICDKWALRDPRVTVIHKLNGGLSDARNAGLDICTGEYIAFVDSDDWIKPNMYYRMMETIIQENADICTCNIVSCYPDRNECWGADRYTVGNSEEMLDQLYQGDCFPVSAWNKLYNRKLWKTFRFPKGKICEDVFTTYLLLHRACRIVQITDPLYCYRIRSGSIMTSSFSIKNMDEEEAWRRNYEFIKDYYPRLYKKAKSFYLQRVNLLIHRIGKEQRDLYREEYDYLRKRLRNECFFIMFRSTTSMKYRIKYLLDLIKL